MDADNEDDESEEEEDMDDINEENDSNDGLRQIGGNENSKRLAGPPISGKDLNPDGGP